MRRTDVKKLRTITGGKIGRYLLINPDEKKNLFSGIGGFMLVDMW